jgi:YVTN family beta-propeller protein
MLALVCAGLALVPSAPLWAQGILGSIPLGGGAQGVEFNAATNRLYVAVGTLNQLLAIDGATSATLAAVAVGLGPSAVAVNSSANRVYVASGLANSVTVIDGASNAVLGTIGGLGGPTGLDLNPMTNRLYVANSATGTLAIVDTTTNAVVGTVPVGPNPRDVAVNPTTNRVYVSNAGSAALPGNTVSVIDGAAGTVLATVPVGSRPSALAVHTGTGRVYVVNQASNSVSVIDGATNAVTATVNVGAGPVGLAINPTTNHVLVTNAGSNDATVIDGATNTVLTTVPLGGVGDVVANPTQGRFVVASQSVPFGLTVVQDPGTGAVPGVPGATGATQTLSVAGAPGVGQPLGLPVPGSGIQLASLPGGSAGAAAAVLSAVLRPLGPLPVTGNVSFAPGAAGQTSVTATLQGLNPGSQATLAVPVASGSLTVACNTGATGTQATCSQSVSGQPSPGATVVVALGGQAVAQGAIVSGGATPLGPVQAVAAAPTQALAGVLLTPAPGSAANGVCNFSAGAAASSGAIAAPASSGGVSADCLVQGLSAGQMVLLNVGGGAAAPLQCPAAGPGGTVTCSQVISAAPLPGSPVTVSAAGLPLAQGAVAPGPQPLPAPVRAVAGAILQPAGTPVVDGIANFTPSGAQTAVTVALEGLTSGQQATVQVPVASGPPAPVLCPPASASGQAVCSQLLNGSPLQGAPVAVQLNGQVVAQGAVLAGPQPGPGGAGPILGAPLAPPPPPPAAPPGLLIPPVLGMGPNASVPGGVPIVPEADSVVLVALGLALIAGAAVWRRKT